MNFIIWKYFMVFLLVKFRGGEGQNQKIVSDVN